MDAIVQAIGTAKVMVLVFSENANNSDDIKREIVLASGAKVTIIPVRVEDVVPKGAFAYQMATRQWIDLFEDWETQIERLAKWIGATAPATAAARTSLNPKDTIADSPSEKTPRETDETEVRRQKKEWERAEQEQAYAKAKGADTVAAIDAFISSYPDSHLAGDAQNARARLLARDDAHRRAMASDDRAVLELFLYSYPNGPHADEILKRLRTLQLKADDEKRLADARKRAEQEQAFAAAKGTDTVAAIDAFIATYPDSHLAGDAQNAKARLLARDDAYRFAMASDDPAPLKSFLNSYPTGFRADEIRERLRRLEPPRVKDPPNPPTNATRGYSKKMLLVAAAIAVVVGIVIISAISSSNQPSYTQAPTYTQAPDASRDLAAARAMDAYIKAR